MIKLLSAIVSILIIYSCSNTKSKWEYRKLKTEQEGLFLIVSSIKNDDTLIALTIDFKNDSVNIYQSKKYPIGISVMKYYSGSSNIHYDVDIAELKKVNGGVFKGKLLPKKKFSPSKLLIKETFAFNGLDLLKDTSNRLNIIHVFSLEEIWPYLFGVRFDLNEDDYSAFIYYKDKKGLTIINKPDSQ